MSKNSTSKISMGEQPDEYPQITQADLDKAVFRQGIESANEKQRITIMLDANIVNYFKAMAGKHEYQTLINDSLKKIAFG